VQPQLRAAEREAQEELKGEPWRLGRAYQFARTKQRILKEKYGIDWRTQWELNPEARID
jgi:hypothetical protein